MTLAATAGRSLVVLILLVIALALASPKVRARLLAWYDWAADLADRVDRAGRRAL